MRWVCILPVGDEIQVTHADIPAPQLLEPSEVEDWAKYAQAARAMRELGLDPPPFHRDAPVRASISAIAGEWVVPGPAGVDDGPDDRVFQSTDIEVLGCPCGAMYGLNGDPEHDQAMRAAHRAHRARCGTSRNLKNLEGHADEGGFVWDAATGAVGSR